MDIRGTGPAVPRGRLRASPPRNRRRGSLRTGRRTPSSGRWKLTSIEK